MKMKIYDISQEVFGCAVYPGDPAPRREIISAMDEGAPYNLTAFSMCAHNGTHIDAPRHFLSDGKTVDEIALEKVTGRAVVTAYDGVLTADGARRVLRETAAVRILFRGNTVISREAAEVFAEAGIDLIGCESQSVGPENAPMEVHRILLGAEVVLLEGIRLSAVDVGEYFLFAAPLALGGADGAPCRAILVKM